MDVNLTVCRSAAWRSLVRTVQESPRSSRAWSVSNCSRRASSGRPQAFALVLEPSCCCRHEGQVPSWWHHHCRGCCSRKPHLDEEKFEVLGLRHQCDVVELPVAGRCHIVHMSLPFGAWGLCASELAKFHPWSFARIQQVGQRTAWKDLCTPAFNFKSCSPMGWLLN